jgi:YVTN family beta-propeller protein
MSADSRIGTEIAGYRIERLLGRGGMGRVYLAEDTSLGRKVALKVLDPELAEDERFRDRFTRESRLAASLDHPNVVPIHEAGESDGVLFIAMRYVEGTDLARLIEAEGPLPLERTVSIVSQVAAALDAAHEQGLIHRDVKPGNILVGKGDHTYLTDFGLIKRREQGTALTKTGQFMGSVDYAAPEQIEGKPVDGRADVYSLGCVTYECLTGEPPYPRDSEMAVLYAHLHDPVPRPTLKRPELTAAVDPVLAEAMAKKPEDRYGSAGDLSTALREALTRPPTGRPVGMGTRRRRRLIATAAGVVVVAAVVSVVVASLGGRPAPGSSPTQSASPGSSARASPLHGALVEVDPSTRAVVQTIRNLVAGHIATDTKPRVVIGEGGIWLLGAGSTGLVYVDPRSGKATPFRVEHFVDDLDVGLHAVWVARDLAKAQHLQYYIARVDPATRDLIRNIPLPASSGSSPPRAGVGSGSVWAGDGGSVVRIDPTTNKIVKVIPVEGSVDLLAVGPGRVWVADQLTNLISEIDPRTNQVVHTLALQATPDAMAADADGLWVLNQSAHFLTEISAASGTAQNPISVGKDPSAVAFGGGKVWVANLGDGTVMEIDPATREVVKTIPVGGPAGALAVDPDTGSLWVYLAGQSLVG